MIFSPVLDGMAADSGWGWGTDGYWHILGQYFPSSTCIELSLWNRELPISCVRLAVPEE